MTGGIGDHDVREKVSARTIRTATHGRYLVRPARRPDARRLLVGFHGYLENAEIQMERLVAIEAVEAWTLISIQGLNRFYRSRTEQVVSGWMTRQDRELAIADNLAYVAAVIQEVSAGHHGTGPLVFAGFSQGVAMAFRAACAVESQAGVVAIGGDIPPELSQTDLRRLSGVLLARGERDDWYTAEKWGADRARLRKSGVANEALELDAGHEWTTECGLLIGRWLKAPG